MSNKQRRTFDAEFKLQVVQIIREQGLSVSEVCRDLMLGETALRQWFAQAHQKVAGRPNIGRPLITERQRIRQLETEKKQLRSDVDTLKKASAFFARGAAMTYQFLGQSHKKLVPVERLCRVLGVSRSGCCSFR